MSQTLQKHDWTKTSIEKIRDTENRSRRYIIQLT